MENIAEPNAKKTKIRKQLKQIIKESPVADIVGQTIRQVQAAIMVSVTTAIVASTAGSRH